MWFVYVLLCQDGTFYTGSTNDLKKRFLEHKKGRGGSYTRSHRVSKIIYSEQLTTRSEALRRENEIKKWRRNKKIQVLNLTKFT